MVSLLVERMMSKLEQMQHGRQLLLDGRSDEDVEHLTGITLMQIIGLRAAAAAAPGDMTENLFRSAYDLEETLTKWLAFEPRLAYKLNIGGHDHGAAD